MITGEIKSQVVKILESFKSTNPTGDKNKPFQKDNCIKLLLS